MGCRAMLVAQALQYRHCRFPVGHWHDVPEETAFADLDFRLDRES